MSPFSFSSNVFFKASELGFSDTSRTVTFYVEGVTENANIQTYAQVQQYGKPTSSIQLNVFPLGNIGEPAMTDTVNYIVGGQDTFYYQLLYHEELRASLAAQGIYERDNNPPQNCNLPQYCLQYLSFEELMANGFKAVDAGMLSSDDPVTGFAGGVYHDYISGKNILAFHGTDATSWNDWYNNIKQALSPPAPQYDLATGIADHLKKAWQGRGPSGSICTPTAPTDWIIAGHSLGGGLAAAASMVSDFHGITFNAAGVNLGSLKPYQPGITSVAQMRRKGLGGITSYVVDWDILNNFQDGVQWLESIDISLPPASLGTRVTLDSPLDAKMVWGTFEILVGGVTLVAGGSGATTALSGVYTTLSTMVEAHGLYVECLLLSYHFPLA